MNGMRWVDGLTLPDEFRKIVRPGEMVRDRLGRMHALPRYFYSVESWQEAKGVSLAPHFTLAELLTVDCREHPVILNQGPHYVPCAIQTLARYLEVFRTKVDAPVFISANGGYRSPGHLRSAIPDPHCWGTAVDIYRIGSTLVDNEETITKYGNIAAEVAEEVFAKRWGYREGETDDHLHLDLGYLCLSPREADEAQL